MTSLANATPAPGTNPNMPTPPPADPAPQPDPTPAPEAGAAPAPAEPAPAPAPAEPDLVYVPTGDSNFDAVGKLLANRKVPGAKKMLEELNADGEFSLDSKAKLMDALGADTAELVMNSVQSSLDTARERGVAEGQRIKQYTADLFGPGTDPESTWANMQQYANSEASGLTEADRAALNSMLGKGGAQAEMAVRDIFNRYRASSGYSQQADLLAGNSATATTFEGISKAEYAEQMREITQTHGYNSQQAEALRNRRRLSIERGI